MPDYISIQDIEQFDVEVLRSDIPVTVYFFSEDCLPCATFSQIFERTSSSLSGQIKFVKVFRPHSRPLAEKYGVRSSPTVMFFRKATEVCSRLAGYISYTEFREALEKLMQKSCLRGEKSTVRCDVLILGAGPAGLTAAIYTARSRLNTIVVDISLAGGQVANTFHIANYPGSNGVIRGIDLMENMKKQAAGFGALVDDMQQIEDISLDGGDKLVTTDTTVYHAKSIIIATGAEPRKLPAQGEREFRGRGVHYCATCDGALYQDADVIVVGGGASAIEEAVFLSRYAKNVTIVNRSDHFKAAQSSVDEALKSPLISVLWNTNIVEIKGDAFVKGIVLEDAKTGERTERPIDGIFVYIGTQPSSGMFQGKLKLSEGGYILTDENMAAGIPGVFAAGDIRHKEIRQISTAVGDGTVAGIMAERFVNHR